MTKYREILRLAGLGFSNRRQRKKDFIGRNLFNHTAFLDEIKQQSKKGESRPPLSSEK